MLNKRLLLTAILLVGSGLLINDVPSSLSSTAQAQVAGQWTHCIITSDQGRFNVVNAGTSKQVCFAKGQTCEKELKLTNSTVTHHSSAVIINAPFKICKA